MPLFGSDEPGGKAFPSALSGRRRRGFLIPCSALVALFAVAAWGYGLSRFTDSIPAEATDTATPTDAIVVLTGGSGRLTEGFRLLSENRAKKLFISGAYRGVEVGELARMFQHIPRQAERRVGIGNATNTLGNALETAEWIATEGYSSLRLVTAAYHMPRSLLEFRHAMPEIMVIAHPVFPAHVKRERWWAWPGTASLVISEFNKFLLAWARHKAAGMIVGETASKTPS